MKNAFKTMGIVLTLSAALCACNSNGNKSTTDSTNVESTSKSTTDTTVKTDTMVARDTNTLEPDTSKVPTTGNKVDTLKKTVTKTTVVKKKVTQ